MLTYTRHMPLGIANAMSQFPRYALLLLSYCAIFSSIRATENDYRKLFFRGDIADNATAIFSCVNFTALRLFNDGNRVGVICYKCGRLENEIIRMFMKKRTVMVSNRPLPNKNERLVSYVVFAGETFSDSQRGLLNQHAHLHMVQYLFVNAAREEEATAFAEDLWREGFRDIAFLTLKASSARGTIRVPVKKDETTVALQSVGYCSSSGSSLDRIAPYNSNFSRFCPQTPCTLLYGAVNDESVQFWREEDQLKLSETKGVKPIGEMLINRFTSFYDMESRVVDKNLSWPEAARQLINGELDVVIGLPPKNTAILDGLQIVCWYRSRRLIFAAQVRRRVRDHPVLQLFMPFHYSVWICAIIMLIVYVLLLRALMKLADTGLISERLYLAQIYEITMAQNITSPKRTSLRAILALWMIFSFNFSILYNSTSMSFLADSDTEDLLKNLKGVRDSGMTLIGPRIVQQFLDDSDDPIIVDLRNRYRVMKRAEETFNEILSKSDVMGVIQQITVDRMNWVTRTDRKLRIYTLPEPVLMYPGLFYTRADHPYRVPFERIVAEYRQSGLLYKWVKYYVIDEDKQIATSHENAQDENSILTMKHLRSVFQFFFLCHGISVLLFLIQLLKYYFLKTNNIKPRSKIVRECKR